MKNIDFIKICFFSALLVVISCAKETDEGVVVSPTDSSYINVFKSEPIEGRYIVVYNTSNNLDLAKTYKADSPIAYQMQKEELHNFFTSEFKPYGIAKTDIVNTYTYSLKGFTVNLSKDKYELMLSDSRVKSIEQDYRIMISPEKGKPGGGKGNPNNGNDSDPSQVIPYGVIRVGGETYLGTSSAWIIDSGIDLDHPDLNVDVSKSTSMLSGSPANLSPDDQNGHGTHVAGTVAAIDNTIGVTGVAAGATVVSVKVLDRKGSGSLSGVIAGVDYVASMAQTGDVANLSLGGGISIALDNAVIQLASSGIKVAVAAGNSSSNANNYSPARANHSNIYTISAMDNNDNFASFSNYGNPPIDYCAPGVSIHSTWKNGGYNTISGTSMASPHVCGLLLLGPITTDGYVNNDPDGTSDPIAHH